MPKTPLQSAIESRDEFRRTQLEGGEGFNPFDAVVEQEAEIEFELRMQDLERRAPEIRVAWNAAVAKYARNGGIDIRDLPAIEREAGITKLELDTLKSRLAAKQ